MKRFFDIFLSLFFIIIFSPLFFILKILFFILKEKSLIFWSPRVGKNNLIFMMPKIRTMKANTPQIASHLLKNPEDYYITFGKFLRQTSFDEIPQLWSILIGDMSFVGPRPALFNQYDLIKRRSEKGVDRLMPGLTGWAQINGRDYLSEAEKIKFDEEYMKKRTFLFDLKILYLTFIKIIRREL
jgi:O-antigen biosynthesis protein WbqP